MSYAAKRPDIEVKRRVRGGATRTYATVYYRPLSVWVLGHWLIGGKRVRAAWEAVEEREGNGS